MKIVASSGSDAYARVYIAEFQPGKLVEFVEAIQPPRPRQEKWVFLVSTLFGCPVGCQMCDAGGFYRGKLTATEILAQIDYLVDQRYPDRIIPSQQFKIQFARMGEPALNPQVLDVLETLPTRYQAPGLMPSFSTIAPAGCDPFFERLLAIKERYYPDGQFQMQFSIHTTDPLRREQLMPVKKWSFSQIAGFGQRFRQPGDRKVTLNFVLAEGLPLEPAELLKHFSPDTFLIKVTPLNPTYQSRKHGLNSALDPWVLESEPEIAAVLRRAGYQVVVSIGEPEENRIGSNCGQYLRRHLEAQSRLEAGYTYAVEQV